MSESKYKIKVICGYRQDQEFSIPLDEAHKVYYLFNNPEKRGTFNSGIALKGADIQRIVPDYHASMGWNPTHKLDSDDYNELHSSGVMPKIHKVMQLAKEVAKNGELADLSVPLFQLREKYKSLQTGSKFAQKVLENKKVQK